MCAGVAVYWRNFPAALVEHHVLHERWVARSEGTEPEVQFLFRAVPRLIPAWHEGHLGVFVWGNYERRPGLPPTGWIHTKDLDEGRYLELQLELVDVPACFGLDRGVWYPIREGIRGVLVRDGDGGAHVYLLVEPASHYYQTMTRSAWMPVLIGERI